MKAVIYNEYGEPSVLHTAEVNKPECGDNDLLIRVKAVEATKTDVEFRSMKFSVKWFALPVKLAMGFKRPKKNIIGGYFAGIIEETGKNVTRLKKGDEVFGSTAFDLGAYAEYMRLPDSRSVMPRPDNISFEETAGSVLGGLNALHFLELAGVNRGDHVLVNGAGGSIGTYAILIARAMGATVTAVDKTEKLDFLKQTGATETVDYTREDILDRDVSYDIILNLVPSAKFSRCMKRLKKGGRYIIANGYLFDIIRTLWAGKLSGKKAYSRFAGEKREELTRLKEMFESGQIKPVVDRVYNLDQAAEAHRRVEDEHRLGPVVIKI